MTKNYVFSATDNAFYPLEMREMYEHAGTWPSDGLDVDDDTFTEFSGRAPEGKMRAAGEDGLPCWVDIPSPSADELIASADAEKQRLIAVANATIELLADAIEFDMATTEERQRSDDWRRYRVLLARVDTAAILVNWPAPPAT